MGHSAQNISANLIFLFTLLPNFSGRWVARVQSEGEWCGENCFISLLQHEGVWVGVWLHTWHTVTATGPSPAWQRCPWSCRTSAILVLAGDLSSSLMAEGWGMELALETGCSFFERWELFCSHSLRFTVGPQCLSPHGVLSLSLLSWPMLWFSFSFHHHKQCESSLSTMKWVLKACLGGGHAVHAVQMLTFPASASCHRNRYGSSSSRKKTVLQRGFLIFQRGAMTGLFLLFLADKWWLQLLEGKYFWPLPDSDQTRHPSCTAFHGNGHLKQCASLAAKWMSAWGTDHCQAYKNL